MTDISVTDGASCKHEHLAFGSGGYYLICRDCQAHWMAVAGSDQPDYTRNAAELGPDDHRDKPGVLAAARSRKS